MHYRIAICNCIHICCRCFLPPEHQRQFDVAVSTGTSPGYDTAQRRNSQPTVGRSLEMFRRHSGRHLCSVPNLSIGTRCSHKPITTNKIIIGIFAGTLDLYRSIEADEALDSLSVVALQYSFKLLTIMVMQ